MKSYSRVSLFKQCPYRYKLRYVDEIETYPDLSANNPLYLGTAMHTAIESGDVQKAINEYYANYPIITDEHVEEAMKLEAMLPKALKLLPLDKDCEFEHKITNHEWIGYIDCLAPTGNLNEYDIYDFKYANKADSYRSSPQVMVYKDLLERFEGRKVRDLYYLFIPKTNIRMKRGERPELFRKRLKEELEGKQPELIKVAYDQDAVAKVYESGEEMERAVDFPKCETKLCDWCEYKRFCYEGKEIDIMKLPKNERIGKGSDGYLRLWLYGMPFAGKTYLANQFPDVLMLNTDGNSKWIDAPSLRIRDEVTVEGRITKRKLAWDVFKETMDELEKGSEFKTIVLDLVEDTYEMCRRWGYEKLGIEHESDDSFKAWDFIRSEFLSQLRRFTNLDYNVILISHEDISRDIMKKGGDKVTAIKPNINDKVALKLAGMVDIVGRVIKIDDYTRVVSFKTNDIVFGGGRLNLKNSEIPNTYNALMDAVESARQNDGKAEEETVKAPSDTPTPSNVTGQKPDTPEVTIVSSTEIPTTIDQVVESVAQEKRYTEEFTREKPQATKSEDVTPPWEINETKAEEPRRRARRTR